MFNPFRKTYSSQERATFEFLSKNHFFAPLEDHEKAEFLPFMYLRKYQKNEAVFFRGDPSQAFYLIKKGAVSLNIDVEDKFENLVKLREGDSFGDNALMDSAYRIYNAICVSEGCELYVIPTTNIQEIFEDNVNIKAKMMYAMAEYFDRYFASLFKAYKESFGFFDLGRAFSRK
ncbi:cyclic nucleotide-binding domain-containing protein [Rapidithrix thailandica]|uniref:Cyclic nucleotide-binding domain-containing protein n=1 Tax=Rapidithrix thailandica TaxID=413964 RepID=A0AAW9S8H4_9BACT